jgi:predicted RNA-binding Zn-ribbon protein involved in translation (DUF1610 family)
MTNLGVGLGMVAGVGGTVGSAVGGVLQNTLGGAFAPAASKPATNVPTTGLSAACPKCGAALLANAKFCLECGAPLARKCPNCGAEVPPNGKFCSECGHKTESEVRS